MVPSICHSWYYTTLRFINSEVNGPEMAKEPGLVFKMWSMYDFHTYRGRTIGFYSVCIRIFLLKVKSIDDRNFKSR